MFDWWMEVTGLSGLQAAVEGGIYMTKNVPQTTSFFIFKGKEYQGKNWKHSFLRYQFFKMHIDYQLYVSSTLTGVLLSLILRVAVYKPNPILFWGSSKQLMTLPSPFITACCSECSCKGGWTVKKFLVSVE